MCVCVYAGTATETGESEGREMEDSYFDSFRGYLPSRGFFVCCLEKFRDQRECDDNGLGGRANVIIEGLRT